MITRHGFYTVQLLIYRIATNFGMEEICSWSPSKHSQSKMTNTAVYIPKDLLALHRQGPHESATTATIVIKKNGAFILRRRSSQMRCSESRDAN